jgi:hypothetical protein
VWGSIDGLTGLHALAMFVVDAAKPFSSPAGLGAMRHRDDRLMPTPAGDLRAKGDPEWLQK